MARRPPQGQRMVQLACAPLTRARLLLVLAAQGRLAADHGQRPPTINQFAADALAAELDRRRRNRRSWPPLSPAEDLDASWPGRRKGVPNRPTPMTAELLLALPADLVDQARRAAGALEPEIVTVWRSQRGDGRLWVWREVHERRITVAELVRAAIRHACVAALSDPDTRQAARDVRAIWRARRDRLSAGRPRNAATFIRTLAREPLRPAK